MAVLLPRDLFVHDSWDAFGVILVTLVIVLQSTLKALQTNAVPSASLYHYPLVLVALKPILRVGERRARLPCILKGMKLAFLYRFVREYGEG